jgi:hypothetical protein
MCLSTLTALYLSLLSPTVHGWSQQEHTEINLFDLERLSL